MICERTRRDGWNRKRIFNGGIATAAFFWLAFVGVRAPFVFANMLVPPRPELPPASELSEGPVSFDNDLAASIGVSVGIDGVYKSGFPTKVVVSWAGIEEFAGAKSESEANEANKISEINASNGEARENPSDFQRAPVYVELETVDSDGTPFALSRRTTPEEIAAGRAELTAIFPKANGKLTVRLRLSNRRVAEKTFVPSAKRAADSSDVFPLPAASSKPIYLVVGDDKLGVLEAFGELRWKEERRPNVVRISKFSELPTDFRAYEAVERLVLTTTDPEFFSDVDAANPRIRTIERWVERGGDVVLLAGEKSIPLLSANGALSAFSPGNAVAEKTHEFRVVNSLVADLKNVKNLALTGSRAFPFLNVPVVSDLKPNAVVEMLEAETPLLVARPVGLGTVVFFAADLATPPFSNWSGRGKLWLKILGFDVERANAKSSAQSFVERGFDDLSGQLRGALDAFDGVRIVPFSLVLAAIFVFLLAIGPLDWFLAKKVFKKPSLTWATFPIYVVAFCVAVVWATNASRPNKTLLNRAEIVDVDVESGIVRDVSWFGLYSPNERRRDLSISPNVFPTFAPSLESTEKVASLAPLTLDGAGLGGAEEKSISTRLWDAPYRLDAANDFELFGVPTATRSSKSFVGRWSSRLKGLPAPGTLVDDGLTLRGSVVNPFDVPIYSAFVVYLGGAYSLGTLPPGETPISRSASRLETRRVLNEHRSSVPTDRLANWDATTYQLDSTRIPYILRTLSFYQFAGGENSFGVAKRQQGDVDLSDLLRCGRAAIFGTIVDSEAEKYRPTEGARKAADALELEALNRKIAEERGDESKTPDELAREKYGDFGSSPTFEPTKLTLRTDEKDVRIEGKQTVVVRLIVPLARGAAPSSATP